MNREQQKELKEKIISLRKQGKSIRDISDILGCAKSTVSNHCRYVPFSTMQQEELNKKRSIKISQQNQERYSCDLSLIPSSQPISTDIQVSIGLLGEELVRYRLHRAGFEILLPPTNTPGCDIVVRGKSGKYYRCEIKSSNSTECYFKHSQYNPSTKRYSTVSYDTSSDIDFFIAVLLQDERLFIVPFNEHSPRMHFGLYKNNQYENRYDYFI